MDKITVALSAAEDNAAALRELAKTVARRTSCSVLGGASVNGKTSFGTVASDGKACVIAAFSGASATLKFCGNAVSTSESPVLAVLPSGMGALELDGVRTQARALVIGG